MKRLTLIVAAVALVAAACGSSSESDATTTTTSGSGGSDTTTTTTMAADTTTSTTEAPAETTTTVAAPSGDVASCVVGVWELDSQQFFETMLAELTDEGVEDFVFSGGTYSLTVGADGTFIDEREDWSFTASTDYGDIEIVINDRNEGTYTLDGDVLSTTIDMGEPAEITILVDGVPFEPPGGVSPVTPPDASFTGATVTCSDDTLTATYDDSTSYWTRAG